ncbi:MAG: T9SS type A sorting domain-containing protein [Bacteroidota bacterium]
MRNSTSYKRIAHLLLFSSLFLFSNYSVGQITYIGNPLTVPPSANNNGSAVPNSFCNRASNNGDLGNCFDIDFPSISTDDNTSDGIIGPFDGSGCNSLDARFVFSSSGDLDNGDDVFLCYRLNLATTYIVANNQNAPNNPAADTDCGADPDANDSNVLNYNENATIGGVSNCAADWTNVPVDVNLYTGPPSLGSGVTFQFRACTDFDNPDEQITLDEFTIFGDGCNFNIFLPLDLIQFGAKLVEEQVQIAWSSASASNFSHYEVEHSIDGKSFQNIHKKDAESEQLQVLFHYWLHKTPKRGDNYYRLKMIDLDGSFAYSEVVVVKWEEKSKIKVYPNPSTDYFTLQQTTHQEDFELRLTNSNGQQVRYWAVEGGSADQSFALSNLPTGIYQLIYTDSKSREVVRLVKQ